MNPVQLLFSFSFTFTPCNSLRTSGIPALLGVKLEKTKRGCTVCQLLGGHTQPTSKSTLTELDICRRQTLFAKTKPKPVKISNRLTSKAMCRVASVHYYYYYLYQPVHLDGYTSFEEIKRIQTERCDYQNQDNIKSMFFLNFWKSSYAYNYNSIPCYVSGKRFILTVDLIRHIKRLATITNNKRTILTIL